MPIGHLGKLLHPAERISTSAYLVAATICSDDIERLGVGVAGRPLIGLGAQNDGLPQPVILGQAFALRPGLGQRRRL